MSTLSERKIERKNLEQELNLAIQRWGNLNVLFTHGIASHIGLSATEFEALSLLNDYGPMAAGRLARLSGLTTGAITGLIDRLEKAKLAQRRPDPDDRRRVMVCPCENAAAKSKIGELYRPVMAAFEEIVSHYNDEQLATVLEFIERSTLAIDQVAASMQGQKTAK